MFGRIFSDRKLKEMAKEEGDHDMNIEPLVAKTPLKKKLEKVKFILEIIESAQIQRVMRDEHEAFMIDQGHTKGAGEALTILNKILEEIS